MPSYKISNLSGFDLDSSGWEKSSGGNTCKAKRKSDGVQVFIKQYTGLKEPVKDESTSPALFAKKMEKFERLVHIRSDVNQRMRKVSGKGGNIIVPYDEFVNEHLYTEVAEFVPGLMSPDDILAMSIEDKMKFAMTAVNALQTVHDNGVIHIDIKPPNVIAVRNSYGIAVGKIIDFDNSLISDLPVPAETGGDMIYQSPELAYYGASEGDPEIAKLISEKTDVFSLGITLHYYLTGGKLPDYADIPDPSAQKKIDTKKSAGKTIYPWEPLLADGHLIMSPDLPAWVSEILAKMTECDPNNRPTCREVFSMLQGGGKKVADRFDAPRITDSIVWDEDALRSDGFTGIHFSSSMNKYELTKNGSVHKRMDVRKLISKGYAREKTVELKSEKVSSSVPTPRVSASIPSVGTTGMHSSCTISDTYPPTPIPSSKPISSSFSPTTSPSGFDEPDQNDGIVAWNIDKLRSRMYTGIKSLGGGNYRLFIGSSDQGIYDAERLLRLKYAIPGTRKEENVFEEPDPSDEIQGWNIEKLSSRGYTGIRSLGDGKYVLISNGHNQGEYSAEKLLRLGYALQK